MKLPERWLNCPNRSEPIMDKFIVLKTPLNHKYDDLLDEDHYFKINNILPDETQKNSRHLNIGLFIDLTKSFSYYDSEEITSKNCEYKKILCQGFGETPSEQQVNEFCEISHNFFLKNPSKLIAVHCTHGFNRSGFMVISYLIKKLNLSLVAANAIFSTFRPPGIYKKHYLEELNERYANLDQNLFISSQNSHVVKINNNNNNNFDHKQSLTIDTNNIEQPYWHLNRDNENDFNNKFNANNNNNNTYGNNDVKKKTLLGIESISNQKLCNQIKKMICEKLGLKSANKFPGSQPVSLDYTNISNLESKAYKVSWKADGQRLLMYIKDKSSIYFADRDFTLFSVGNRISFCCKDDLSMPLKECLIDGELVIDKLAIDDDNNNNNGYNDVLQSIRNDHAKPPLKQPSYQKIPRFLAYDLMLLNDQYVGNLDYEKRVDLLSVAVETPRRRGIYEKLIRREDELFGFRCKTFFNLNAVKKLLSQEFQSNISHDIDGLIFQPIHQHYVRFTNRELLKWKPGDQNSIDFLLNIVIDQGGLGKVPWKRVLLLLLSAQNNAANNSSSSNSDYYYHSNNGNNKRFTRLNNAPWYSNKNYEIFGEIKYSRELEKYDNCIVECTFDWKTRSWQIMRQRHDKSFPNHFSVGESIMRAICNPIDATSLIAFISQIEERNNINKKMINHEKSLSQPDYFNQNNK